MSYGSILNMTLLGILPSFVIAFIGYSIYVHKKKNHQFSMFLFILYITMLFYVTVYRYGISITDILSKRPSFNLIPFISTYELLIYSGWDIFLYNVLGNIVWFFPFGYFVACIQKQRRGKEIFLYSILLSTSIEITQFILNCGISDIDDIVFNAIGGCIGYLFYKLFKMIKSKSILEK